MTFYVLRPLYKHFTFTSFKRLHNHPSSLDGWTASQLTMRVQTILSLLCDLLPDSVSSSMVLCYSFLLENITEPLQQSVKYTCSTKDYALKRWQCAMTYWALKTSAMRWTAHIRKMKSNSADNKQLHTHF
jgi:hypothetical protein